VPLAALEFNDATAKMAGPVRDAREVAKASGE
jgi:hypothetical protein